MIFYLHPFFRYVSNTGNGKTSADDNSVPRSQKPLKHTRYGWCGQAVVWPLAECPSELIVLHPEGKQSALHRWVISHAQKARLIREWASKTCTQTKTRCWRRHPASFHNSSWDRAPGRTETPGTEFQVQDLLKEHNKKLSMVFHLLMKGSGSEKGAPSLLTTPVTV